MCEVFFFLFVGFRFKFSTLLSTVFVKILGKGTVYLALFVYDVYTAEGLAGGSKDRHLRKFKVLHLGRWMHKLSVLFSLL
jgi:hypothetical protein